jgi:superfamily II DNA or RNA helicase
MEVAATKEIKKSLTVRAAENAMGIRAPSFRVWQDGSAPKTIRVPRFCDAVLPGDRAAASSTGDAANISFTGTLRDHQKEAISRGVEAFNRDGGGVLSLDVGLGKTVCALALAAQFKRRTLVIVHKGFLADQWIERIQQFCPGATVGRIQQDKFEIKNDFVIAMIQTLCVRPWPSDAFKSVGMVIVDEAHHIAAQAFSQSMFLMNPRYTLGLTATPERKDGLTRLLYWFMGPEFFKLQRRDQEQVTAHRVPFTCEAFLESPPVTNFGKLNFAEVVNILTRIPERNKILKKLISESSGKHILVLTDRREHAVWLKENIENSSLYIGGMKQDELEAATKARVVVGTFSLAQEGLDIPTLDTVFLVTPHSDVKQAIGRIMRGASRPVIWDIVDAWSILYSMWRKRLATYRELGIIVEGEPTKAHQGVVGGSKRLLMDD